MVACKFPFKNILSHFSSESRYPNGYPGNHTKVMYVGSDATEDAMWLYARLLGTMQLTDDVAEGWLDMRLVRGAYHGDTQPEDSLSQCGSAMSCPVSLGSPSVSANSMQLSVLGSLR